MKYSEAVKKLRVSQKTLNEDIYVNPLQVLASDEFNKKPVLINGKDYRNRAIDRAIKLKVNFSNEGNTTFELVKRLIKVVCPHCGEEMKVHGGGGCGHATSTDFRCETCKVWISLSISNEGGLSVRYD